MSAAGALTVDTWTANNSMFIINNGKTADTVTVNQSLNGKNNSLVVVPTVSAAREATSSLPLVNAPKATESDVYVKPNHTTYGFPYLYTATEYGGNGEQQAMAVGGFDVQQDKAAIQAGKSVMDVGYKSFLTEMNNLNYRMGDLRNTHGDTGTGAHL